MAIVEVRILDSSAATVTQSDETHIVQNTTTPKWRAQFDFLVPTRLLELTIVNIGVWDKSSFGRSFLGEVSGFPCFWLFFFECGVKICD